MPSLLTADDPAPVTIDRSDGATGVIVLCDHAAAAVPAALGDLGLTAAELARHIAVDIGAAAVAAGLAARLSATLVRSGFSRLVIDCNRTLDDPTSIPEISDGVAIPGNLALSPADRAARVEACFAPYHRTIAAWLDRANARGAAPAILSIHSFTPVWAGAARPWEIGVLYGDDSRIATPLLAALAADGVAAGDNLPYSGRPDADEPASYTIPMHAEARGLPHILIEIRQDLIASAAGAARWTDRLAAALEPILDDLGAAGR